MSRSESFIVNRSMGSLPTVSEVGIFKALQAWRLCSKFTSNAEHFSFSLCTEKTEYIFSIDVRDTNFYCGASCNWVFDLGLFCAGQYFRIRNYKDNSEPFCGFGCDFSYVPKINSVPTDRCEKEKFCFLVKKYDDEEIVLNGYGADEYIYRREERRAEIFIEG